MNKAPLPARLTLWILVALLATPILITLVYSLSAQWGAQILPRGFTLDWYQTLWSDGRFLAAFGRSLLVCAAALALSLLLILPTLFVVFYYFPRLKGLMNLLILLPFAVPAVVSSVGLLQLYAGGPLPLVGTPWILVFSYFTLGLPFMYRALANNLEAVNLPDLMDAAHLLGAGTARAFLQVVLPNIRNGLLSALFLAFSFLFGEFVFANLLVGTRFETLQVYLYSQRTNSGHFTSAMVMSYFLFIGAATWLALRLQSRRA
ncbi:ABC transporter permease [Zobellella endophytica]|uniref:ABC transporter permease n=1 Tax=Zobellella endophytica TaxID=2116700 RepID=A0A2P7R698_9GAMM|nr:ABC transporter permease [Zobellella endophytica]PSJ45727.1 ABC transporter permease [Zobellella endophytica]